jgi:hypothetical protein
MDHVLLVGLAADDNVIHLSKGSLMTLSTCLWKDALASLRTNGTLLYSKRPKGVVIAVFCMSAGQCCGSGIGCLFDPWIRDPGWEKVSIRIRDP